MHDTLRAWIESNLLSLSPRLINSDWVRLWVLLYFAPVIGWKSSHHFFNKSDKNQNQSWFARTHFLALNAYFLYLLCFMTAFCVLFLLPRLVLVLRRIGWKSGASFFNQSEIVLRYIKDRIQVSDPESRGGVVYLRRKAFDKYETLSCWYSIFDIEVSMPTHCVTNKGFSSGFVL